MVGAMPTALRGHGLNPTGMPTQSREHGTRSLPTILERKVYYLRLTMPPLRITIRNLYADLPASTEHFRSNSSAVEASRHRIEASLADGQAHYGINTGFGALANERVPDHQLGLLQRNLL